MNSRKVYIFLFFIAYTLFLGKQFEDTNKRTREVENKLTVVQEKPSVEYLKSVTVYIFNFDKDNLEFGSVGTGVVVEKKNGYYYILTNAHVCDDNSEGFCSVVVDGRNILLDKVKVSQNPFVDLSLWKTNQEINKNKIKGISDNLKIGNNYFSLGNYRAFPFVYTEGTYVGNILGWIAFNMPIAGGCSGSGIFNKEGYLVGIIHSGTSKEDSTKAIAMASDAIKQFISNSY